MKAKRLDFDRLQRIKRQARDKQPIRGVRPSLTIQLARGCKLWQPFGSRKIWDKKKSPLSVYVSPSIFKTNNKLGAPLENKMRDTFSSRSVSFVHFV